MKILIFGAAGRMGQAIAWDLSRDKSVDEVGLFDCNDQGLFGLALNLGSSKTVTYHMDLCRKEETKKILSNYDVAVIAVPNRLLSYSLLELGIETGIDMIDILEEYHLKPDLYETEGLKIPDGLSLREYGEELHERAIARDITLLDGMGFAPGLSNITVANGITKLDHAYSVVARVGGIPNKETANRHPLKYMTTWSLEHVLREYNVKTDILVAGKVKEVSALSDYEVFTFEKFGKSEDFECAVTPGMPSFIYTHPKLIEFSEKTIRWPGHYQGISTLQECSLLDIEDRLIDGVKISPRELTLQLLNERLMPLPGDSDICVMYNTIIGEKGGDHWKIEYHMWEEADLENGFSAMARVTGFTAAVGAKFLANKKISAKGIRAPEECIVGDIYDDYINELKLRDITIEETILRLT